MSSKLGTDGLYPTSPGCCSRLLTGCSSYLLGWLFAPWTWMGRRRSASDGSRPEMQKQHLSLTCLVDIWQNDCFCSAQSEVVNEKKCLLGLQIAEDRLAMRSAPLPKATSTPKAWPRLASPQASSQGLIWRMAEFPKVSELGTDLTD